MDGRILQHAEGKAVSNAAANWFFYNCPSPGLFIHATLFIGYLFLELLQALLGEN